MLTLAIYFFVRSALGVATDGDELSGDTNRNLFGGKSADFKSHRSKDAFKFFRAVAVGFERLIGGEHFALASNHADIAGVCSDGPGKYAHVFFVAARDDDQVGRRIRAYLRKCAFEISENLFCHRETVTVGELLAVVDYDDSETSGAGRFSYGNRDVAPAKQVCNRLRQDWFDEDFESSTTNQAIVKTGFVIQIEDHFARGFAFHHFACGSPDVCFHAAAADGADDSAIFAYEHARTLETGDGAVRVDNRS